MYKCDHYLIRELVSKVVYDYYSKLPGYGENYLWRRFPELLLRDADFIREAWEKYLKSVPKYVHLSTAININTWSFGGSIQQRGYRSNIEQIVEDKTKARIPYSSGHCTFQALDMEPANGLVDVFHQFVWGLMLDGKLKFFKRLESAKVTIPLGYIHVDGLETASGTPEVFNP